MEEPERPGRSRVTLRPPSRRLPEAVIEIVPTLKKPRPDLAEDRADPETLLGQIHDVLDWSAIT